jgi:hypothetical protein
MRFSIGNSAGGAGQARLGRVAAVAFGACALVVACGPAGGTSPADADAGAWTAPLEVGDAGALLSVFGTLPDEILAVGGQPEAGVAWRFDGVAWRRLDLPPVPLLNWVHGVDDTVFLVGNDGVCLRRRGAGAFERLETGVAAPLWGVFAVTPSDVWVVGGDATPRGDAPPAPVLLHFDGDVFEPVALPPVDRTFRAVFKVWAADRAHVWAVGQAGVVLAYDGRTWAQVLVGTDQDLISLWGTGPDRVAAVGGRSHGVLARFDGVAWRTEVVTDAERGTPSPGLNGLFMAPDGVSWAVGDRGHVLRLADGAFEAEREATPTSVLLHGLWGTPDGHRVAVGGTLLDSPPWEGVLLEFGR